jgi:hypothetical protein
MKHKSEARQRLIEFISLIENQHKTKVRAIRSDNGPEFIMPQFYASKGIFHQTSCVETPQQNARVERKHQHILNVARALLFQAHLPKHFWSYVVFLINRVPTSVLKDKSPYEVLNNELPNLESLKVFGSLAYATTLQAHRTKLSHRGRKCIYLGYKQRVKGVILYDLNSKEIFVSRHVTHHDHILPYQSSNQVTWHYHTDYTPTDYTPIHNLTDPDNNLNNPDNTNDTNPDLHTPDTNHDQTNTELTNPNSPSVSSDKDNLTLPDTPNEADKTIETHNETVSPQNTNLSRPIRNKHVPSYLTDYVCNASADLSKSSSKGSKYPICDYHTFRNLSASYHAYTLSVTHYKAACRIVRYLKQSPGRGIMFPRNSEIQI